MKYTIDYGVKILNALNFTKMSMFGVKTVQGKWLLRYGRLTKNGIWMIAKWYDINRRRADNG